MPIFLASAARLAYMSYATLFFSNHPIKFTYDSLRTALFFFNFYMIILNNYKFVLSFPAISTKVKKNYGVDKFHSTKKNRPFT